MGRMLAGPIIAAFRRRMPGVQLEVKLQAEQVDLVRDRFDLVLRGGALPDSALKARRLATAKMWLYCSARHQEEPLTALPFIAAPGDEVLLKRAGHHVADRPAVLVDDRTAIADALTWGAGFGLLPSFLGEGPREQGALVRRSDAPIAALPVHALYHPAQREDPRLLALVEEFCRHLERVL
jgi:DNA-binding transcriptional LysR family regulator